MQFIRYLWGSINEEVPKYTLIHRNPSYEIRLYEPALHATVSYPTSSQVPTSTSKAFFKLANYIFAKQGHRKENDAGREGSQMNEGIAMTAPVRMGMRERIAMTAPVSVKTEGEREPIAMTAPVRMQNQPTPSSTGMALTTMTFILPSKYRHMADLPALPSDPDVTIHQVPARHYAVLTYTGGRSAASIQEHYDALRDALIKDRERLDGWKVFLDDWEYWGYNPPITLPCFRTNEIAVKMEKEKTE